MKKNKKIDESESKKYLTNNDTMLTVNDQHFRGNYLSLNDVNTVSEVSQRLPTVKIKVFTAADSKEFVSNNSSKINISNKENNELYNLHLPKFRTKWRAYAQRNFTSDENECLINNGGCEGLCINIPGSYRCHCPKGFRLDVTRRLCLDINECAARNGHGPCQGDCINTWGSYRCDCTSLSGTQLAEDKHSCKIIDACSINNCSHICINTRLGAHCSCPQGYQLNDDWRTCQDVDECQLTELQQPKCLDQHKECRNTVGSYKCV